MSRFFAAAAAAAATIAAPELRAAVPYVKAALDEYPGDLEKADPVKALLDTSRDAYERMTRDPAVKPTLTGIMALLAAAAMNGYRAYLDADDAVTEDALVQNAEAVAAPQPAAVKPAAKPAAAVEAKPG
jgi:hypothetical protein